MREHPANYEDMSQRFRAVEDHLEPLSKAERKRVEEEARRWDLTDLAKDVLTKRLS